VSAELVLEVERVVARGLRWELSIRLGAGTLAAALTSKEEVNEALVKLLVGLSPPAFGRLALFGRELSVLPARGLFDLRRRIGVVRAEGGLVSNLKVWENLVLPLQYHTDLRADAIERAGREVLDRVGYSGPLMALPAVLSDYQRRLIGLARAMLTDPDLVLFESPFEGLTQDEKELLRKTVLEFHGEKPGRASLFVMSSPEAVLDMGPSRVFLV
jgi:phospholipid/cholesterol/gamma-HCH transport system ATP-binding protein